MNSKVLISKDSEKLTNHILGILEESSLKRDHPDVLWMEEEKLGMEEAKKVRQFFNLKPYSAKGRAVVVLNAQNLTLDAQNSLLKTLEEPPLHSIILLGVDSDKKLLPTVLSRCEIVNLNSPSPLKGGGRGEGEIEKLINSSFEERFEYIEKLEDKEVFFHGVLAFFHAQLPKHPEYLEFTKELLHAEEWKESNGNIRAILEYLMLRLPN